MIPKIAGWKKNRVSELTEIFNRDGSLRKSKVIMKRFNCEKM